MEHSAEEAPPAHGRGVAGEASLPVIVATILLANGNTGTHTHVQQLRRYLEGNGIATTLVTPFSWGRPLTYPVFGLRRLVVNRCSRAAGVAWYLYWHEVFLRRALRRLLADIGGCVIYAQGPSEARAALRARRGPHQRVVMAVHFRVSRADEYADSREISRRGAVFRAIRQRDGQVIPQVDGLVYVSSWGREALLSWLPEAATVPSAVIGNFAAALPSALVLEPLGDLVTIGRLERAKNHLFLLKALAEAKRAGRSFTLDIYGDGPLWKDLVRQIRSLDLEEQVRLRGFRRDVRNVLPRYRAYVHASYSESLPLAIIEAMAAGLPIVAGDTGGISEMYDDGVEGRFWSLDDPAQAAATLMGLLDSEPARLKAASAASERFRRDFTADVVCPRLWSFLLGPAALPARADARAMSDSHSESIPFGTRSLRTDAQACTQPSRHWTPLLLSDS
jgi:glycosyltransferase involved in cell wall biosynthesis